MPLQGDLIFIAAGSGCMRRADSKKGENNAFGSFSNHCCQIFNDSPIAQVTPNVPHHSLASKANELGLTEATIAALVGHSRGSVTSRHIHMFDTALFMAADAISDDIQDLLDGAEFRQMGTRLSAVPERRHWRISCGRPSPVRMQNSGRRPASCRMLLGSQQLICPTHAIDNCGKDLASRRRGGGGTLDTAVAAGEEPSLPCRAKLRGACAPTENTPTPQFAKAL